jgi:hypothetical protein
MRVEQIVSSGQIGVEVVPALGHWLDMPSVPLTRDSNIPRVQAPAKGASTAW